MAILRCLTLKLQTPLKILRHLTIKILSPGLSLPIQISIKFFKKIQDIRLGHVIQFSQCVLHVYTESSHVQRREFFFWIFFSLQFSIKSLPDCVGFKCKLSECLYVKAYLTNHNNNNQSVQVSKYYKPNKYELLASFR